MSNILTDMFAGAATGIVNKAIDFGLTQAGNAINAKRNFRYNETAAQNAMNRQIALTEMYNTPEAQMNMLKSAGLSPAIYYGMNGISGGIVSNAPQGIMNQQQAIDSSSILENADIIKRLENLGADTGEKEANTNLITNTISKVIEETKNERAKTRLAELQADYQDILNYIQAQTLETNIEKIREDYRNIKANTRYITALAEKGELDTKFMQDNYEALSEQILQNVEQLKSQARLNNENSNYIDLYYKVAVTNAETQYILSLIEDKKVSNEYKIELKKLEARFKEIQTNITIAELNNTTSQQNNIRDNEVKMTTALLQSLSQLLGMFGFGGLKELIKGNPKEMVKQLEKKQQSINEYEEEFKRKYGHYPQSDLDYPADWFK